MNHLKMKGFPLILLACSIFLIVFGFILRTLPERGQQKNIQFTKHKEGDSIETPNSSISATLSPQVPTSLAPHYLMSNESLTEHALVTRVIDGDTIQIEGGKKVRYIGIDTPEIVHPKKPIECFGREAAAKNKELVEGKLVRLEKDVSETDKYGRLLRYVYVDNVFVNEYLVREGYAHASSYPPDVKYQSLFVAAEREAMGNKRGLWESCK